MPGKILLIPAVFEYVRKQRILVEAVGSCLVIVVSVVVVFTLLDQAKVVTAVAAVGVVAAVAVYFFKSRKSQKKNAPPKGLFVMFIRSM